MHIQIGGNPWTGTGWKEIQTGIDNDPELEVREMIGDELSGLLAAVDDLYCPELVTQALAHIVEIRRAAEAAAARQDAIRRRPR